MRVVLIILYGIILFSTIHFASNTPVVTPNFSFYQNRIKLNYHIFIYNGWGQVSINKNAHLFIGQKKIKSAHI